ncbi:MAG TPA: type I methionyl aminopeptidase [Ktedonobacterales bacterium]|nr:type I methionyl aminopeptidase [Ktedonobacterales bacterium]
MTIHYRSKTEIESIRRAGQVVMEILEVLRAAAKPGVTTGELDALAVRELARRNATSNFKGYSPAKGTPPFTGVICASVNEEVVHGVPGKRALKEGDLIALDFGAIVDGWHGDSAITVPVGQVSPEAQRLLKVTQDALWKGIAAARAGSRIFDITRAVQSYVEGEGFSLVEHYGGHGIGRELHEDPFIPNAMEQGIPNPLLRPGMVVCIEPMVSTGTPRTRTLGDKWTVSTADGSLSAHFEHTIAITSGEPLVLTSLVGAGASR